MYVLTSSKPISSKQEAIDKSLIRRIAKVILYTKSGHFLISTRNSTERMPKLKDTSAGGHVLESEDYIDTAKRKVKEELNLEINNLVQISKDYTEFLIENRPSKAFIATFVGEVSEEVLSNLAQTNQNMSLINHQQLRKDLESKNGEFTPGARHSLNKVIEYLNPSE